MNPLATPALDLRDIHAAAPPAFWPPAPGWWVLAVLLLVVLLVTGLWLIKHLRQRRYRRQILDEFERITRCYSKDNCAEFIAAQSTLMRRIALKRYSRSQVASLTGSAWLRFLDETGGNGQFERGVGRVLKDGAYSVRVYFNPLVRLIWIGALIMFFGGAVSLSDRRLRVGAPKAAEKRGKPKAAAPAAGQ